MTHTTAARITSPAALLLTITALFTLQPISTDLYLPSLPAITRYFNAGVSDAQMTLTVFVMAFGIAQLIAGPLSDRFGRWPTSVAATVIYTGASLACALAPTLDLLVIARLFQGIGACMALVNARAIIRDSYSPEDGARLIAKAGSIMAIAILIGPMLGGLLQTSFGWRAAFVALSIAGAVALSAVLTQIGETNQYKNPHATDPLPLLATYGAVIRNPMFIAYTAAQAASYGGLFAFLSGSSPVLQKVIGLSPQAYGMFFASCTLGYLIGTFICRRALRLYGLFHTIHLSALTVLCGGLLMAGLALAGLQHWAAIGGPMFIYLVGHGMCTPCSQAGSTAAFPKSAGSAAGLMGFLQMVFASGIGIWMGASFNGTVLPLALTVCGGAVSLFVVVFGLVRRYGRIG